MFEDAIAVDQSGIGPREQVLRSQRDREEKQQHQRQREGGGFAFAANRQAPVAAGQVMEHRQRQPAEGNAHDEIKREEIRVSKLARVWIAPKAADAEADDADQQREPLHAAQTVGKMIAGWAHGLGCTFLIAGGVSARPLSFGSLSCKART